MMAHQTVGLGCEVGVFFRHPATARSRRIQSSLSSATRSMTVTKVHQIVRVNGTHLNYYKGGDDSGQSKNPRN